MTTPIGTGPSSAAVAAQQHAPQVNVPVKLFDKSNGREFSLQSTISVENGHELAILILNTFPDKMIRVIAHIKNNWEGEDEGSNFRPIQVQPGKSDILGTFTAQEGDSPYTLSILTAIFDATIDWNSAPVYHFQHHFSTRNP